MSKVTIILATYNGEKYILQQLESLAKQNYENIEVYIHDDCSTDKTVELINKFIKENKSNVVFHYMGAKKLGYPQCFIKTLLEVPKSDYYAFCDQDDVWNADKISNAVQGIKKYGDEELPSLYYSCVDYYDGALNYIRGARFKHKEDIRIFNAQELLLGGEAMGMTFLFNNMVRKMFFELIENGMYDFKDTFMKIYCASCGIVIYSSIPSAQYRRHSDATTVQMNPAGKLNRIKNMANKIFFERDGMKSINDSVKYIYTNYNSQIKRENSNVMELFGEPKSVYRQIKKVFWPRRFRIKLIDEIGYRVAFVFWRI